MKNILLTGAKGAAGAHLVAALARRTDVERILLLLPEASDGACAATMSRLLRFVGPTRVEIDCLRADARWPGFALSDAAWTKLGSSVDTAFHCDESQQIDQDIASARCDHVAPAQTWVEFLEHHTHIRLNHLSTTFVAGRRRGLFTEFDLDCGQDFNNDWEKSRYEAERALRASHVRGRVNIFRPSLIVGDSRDGRAFAPTWFYHLLRLAREGRLKLVAGDPQARLDIVPVNYVAESMAGLGMEPAGRTYHLVAGWAKSLPLKELIGIVMSHSRRRAGTPRIVAPMMSTALRGIGALTFDTLTPGSRSFASYCGYFRQPTVFDDFLTRAALETDELSCPEPESYLGKVIEFAEVRFWPQEAVRRSASRGGSPASVRDLGPIRTAEPLQPVGRVISSTPRGE